MWSFAETQLGRVMIVVKKGFLVYCNWEDSVSSAHLQEIFADQKDSGDTAMMQQALTQLEEYFSGKRKEFNLPLALSGTDFQKKVWKEISKIKYGDTLSYKGLAEKCGNVKAVRAVARACGANPLAVIIPCHRVVGSHGSLGGYSGGKDKKTNLLNLEITFR